MATRPWITPPRLRTLDEDDAERRATWLELFFDLVLVVAVAQLGQELAANPTGRGFAHFFALFIPVWWAWMGFTFYADRFDTDDVVYRLWTLLGMLAVAALAVNVRNAFGGGWTAFVLSYVAVRLVLIALYARSWRHVAEARRLSTVYASAFSVSLILWLVSAAAPAPGRWAVWAAGLLVELAAPLFGWRQVRQAPVHASHIPERFGLFTIIVLGESVLAVVLGTVGTSWHVSSAAVAAACFAVAACLWWIHFDFVDTSVLKRGMAGLVYVYGHLPLVLGIATFGVGTKLAIKAASADTLPEGARWFLCGGTALALGALALLELATVRSVRDPDLWLRLAGAGSALALGGLAAVLPPVAVVVLLAVVQAALVAYEVVGHERHVPVAVAEPGPPA